MMKNSKFVVNSLLKAKTWRTLFTGAIVLSTVIQTSQAMAVTITRNFLFDLDDSQITEGTIFNDVWNSGLIDLDEIIILAPNDSFVANIQFKNNKHLELDDGFFNGDESIKIQVDGEGGVGGAPNNMADYKFEFTGVNGGPLLVNPVMGTATINAINGNLSVDRDVDLINGGKVRFHDIHLTLTNRNVNPWGFDKIGVGVDADVVKIGDWAKEPRIHNKNEEGVGDFSGESPTISFDGSSTLSFSDIFINTVIADGGLSNPSDPINGGEILISDTTLLKSMDQGWFFEDTNLEVQVGTETVLSANLVNSFLFNEPVNHVGFDSEFQADLFDITINNTIGSQYLDELAASIVDGTLAFLSFPSNLLASTDNLNNSGNSNGRVWIDNAAKVPESTSTLSLLTLGTLGAGATLKRKLKASKTTEKVG